MDKSLINTNIEQQFTEVVNLIVQHRSKASMAVNKEMLLTAWHVGAYVSKKLKSEAIQSKNGAAAFVQPLAAQMPKILELTTFTNHIEILCRCKRYEQRLFYILYAHKEKLGKREMQRCIDNDTFSNLLVNKSNMSKGLL